MATTQIDRGVQATRSPLEDQQVHTLDITNELQIAAPVEVVWKTLLDELGPGMEGEKGTMSMTLEAWPGGRWFRDLGGNAGHFWGHVQVIKPPPHDKPLLEICGPMFMSYATASHVQYRLTPEGKGTKLTFKHKAVGLIPREHREGVQEGWGEMLKKIKDRAEGRKG